jgi:predicted TIM-barrel fold metal-dependent hydrolase
MRQRAISADSHIDLSWLPPNLFVEHCSAALRDRVPVVVDSPQGPRWTTRSNNAGNLGFACALGATGRPYIPGWSARADKMAAEGLFEDGKKGIRRLSDPHLRIKDQVRDDVDGEVLYGVLGVSDRIRDQEACLETIRIYNDFLKPFCAVDPNRLIGLASIPCHTPEIALTEAKRVMKAGGLRGFDMASVSALPYHHPEWDAFWDFANEAKVTVHFHTFGPEIPDMTGFDQLTKDRGMAAAFACGQFFRASRIMSSLILGGVLERFPNLRVVFGESGIGWIPYLLDRMNWSYDEEFNNLFKLKMKPSEYWYRQCYASFQAEASSALPVLHLIGYDNVLWASDFPHPDGIWPDSQYFIDRMFSTLRAEVRDKICYGNVAKLFDLPQ